MSEVQPVPVTLQVIVGPQNGVTHILEGEVSRLGRSAECEVLLPDATISRVHARLLREGDHHVVEDLSRYGTFVNGQRVQGRVALHDKDQIKIAKTVLIYLNPLRKSDQPPAATRPAPISPPLSTAPSMAPVSPSDELSILEFAANTEFDLQPDIESSGSGKHVKGRDNGAAAAVKKAPSASPQAPVATVAHTANGKPGSASSTTLQPLELVTKINEWVLSRTSRNQFLNQLVDGLMQVFPRISRAVVLLRDEQQLYVPTIVRHRWTTADHVQINQTLLARANELRHTLLALDDGYAVANSQGEPLARGTVGTVICVPLVTNETEPRAVLWLDAESSTRGFGPRELELCATIGRHVSLAMDFAESRRAMSRLDSLERDLNSAAAMQRRLPRLALPALSGYAFWSAYEPCRAVYPGLFGALHTPAGGLAVFVGDAFPEGIEGATLAAIATRELYLAFSGGAQPKAVLAQVQQALGKVCADDQLVTLALGLLDTTRHTLTVVSAGHLLPLVRRENGTVQSPAEKVIGPPLGTTRLVDYSQEVFSLEQGDMALFFTDGLTESLNPRLEPFSLERLSRGLTAAELPVNKLGRQLLKAVHDHREGRHAVDDLTLLCLSRGDTPKGA